MVPHFKNVIIANNNFITKGNANFINSDSILKKPAAQLLHNNYYSNSNRYVFKYANATFYSLQEWLKANADQEREGSTNMSLNIDPTFANTSFKNAGKEGFRLEENSPLRKQSFLLPDYFEIKSDAKDLGGNTLPADKKIFPGAYVK